ncbi:hypothetical protein E4T44_02346 [Aureobasidium sp. EXF-8845]|nr:hypothetical protein E4T44_02346 [Aureobasidium sp. EXF-8845]
MDAIMESGRKIWEGEIVKFRIAGRQRRPLTAPRTLKVIAFMVGFATQNIQYTLWILLAGAALTFVVCVPPWPFYNKDPVKWLPAKRTNGVTGMNITVDGKKVQ